MDIDGHFFEIEKKLCRALGTFRLFPIGGRCKDTLRQHLAT